MLRVRFAPSPTGFLHIGSARTFIFNWLYARRNGGTMILRIDDTDVERNTEASLDSIFEGLRWLDLGWDEEYHQSERLALHRADGRGHLREGPGLSRFHARAGRRRREIRRAGRPGCSTPGCAKCPREESDRRAAAGEPFALRFRVPRDDRAGTSASPTASTASSPNPPPISKTSRCCAATACPRITWPPAPTMPTCASATSSAARTTSPTPSSTS